VEQPTYRLFFPPSPSTLLFYFILPEGILGCCQPTRPSQWNNAKIYSYTHIFFLHLRPVSLSLCLVLHLTHNGAVVDHLNHPAPTHAVKVSFCYRTTAHRILELWNSTQQNKICTNRWQAASSNSVLGGPGLRFRISVELQQMKYE